MSSKLAMGVCALSFVLALVLIYILTQPEDDVGTTNLILGGHGDSDVLILTSKSATLLPPVVNNIMDLWGITPVEFLKALKMERSTTDEYIFRDPVKNWISKKDLPGLLALTDSKEPCASVALSASSFLNTQGSAMGQEALFMIDGYRKGEYPPALNSGTYDDASAKELVAWCRNEIGTSGN